MDSTITIRIDDKDKEKLMAMAQEQSVPFSYLVRVAIKQFLESPKEDNNIHFGEF